jgi:LysR family cys regulon transcriptional activator
VLAEVDAIEREGAERRARDAGELRIATTHTQARYSLPAAVREFRRRYPAVRLSLQQGSPRQIVELLMAREVDVGIATELPLDLDALEVHPGLRMGACGAGPPGHPVLAEPTLTLEALARYPIVTYVEGSPGAHASMRPSSEPGSHPRSCWPPSTPMC